MFGISFGANKEKTDQTQTVDQNVTGTQATKGKTSSTTKNNSSTDSTGKSNTTGSQAGTQTQTGAQTQTGQTTNFDKGALDAIGGGIGQFISKVLSSPANGGAAMSALGDFDPEQFINSTLLAAKNTQGTKLAEVTRGITQLIGGNAKENSASEILSERATNDAAATLAGVNANAIATAEQIKANRASTTSNIGSADTNALAQVLNAIKGGTSTTTGATVNQSTGATTATTAGSTTTSESSDTSAVQSLQELIDQLVNTNQDTKGTTKVTGQTSKVGGGVSLGL